MIKENQRLFNQLNVFSDAAIVYLMLPLAFWIKFYVLPGGTITVPLRDYMALGIFLTAAHIFTYAAFGLYNESFRKITLRAELTKLWMASALDMTVLLSFLFLSWGVNYSRAALAIFLFLSVGALTAKRVILRRVLRRLRKQGYNQKHVIVLGSGETARKYLKTIADERELGYHAVGFVAGEKKKGMAVSYLGSYDALISILEKHRPDEVVSAIEMEDYQRTPEIIEACEKTGIKLSIIPFYAKYMPSNPQFDSIRDIPLMNIRRIPLDNWANAFMKRTMDIVGSLLLLILTSPIMLVCAVGVRLSSPGPIIFRQERVGRNKKRFYMYKFRSMRVNPRQDTGWSSDHDDRKTRFGSFLRKCSLDEFPQFFNVLKGDMSLVGPRPEIPFYVDRFKEEVPRYMVKHQVRPGITGWAQVHGFRGDTSIKGRIEHDIFYIEHWSILMDIRILLMTVLGGKFMNEEKMN